MSTFEKIERDDARKASLQKVREGVPVSRYGEWRDCSKCKHYGNDLEDRFCAHPHAMKISHGFGQNPVSMDRLGLCGNTRAQLFEADQ